MAKTFAEQLEMETGNNPIDYEMACRIVPFLKMKRLLAHDLCKTHPVFGSALYFVVLPAVRGDKVDLRKGGRPS